MYAASTAVQTVTLARLRLAGWGFHRGPKLRKSLPVGTPLSLKPEPDNPHDAHAIAVFCRKAQIGYLPAHAAPDFGRLVRDGRLAARVAQVNEVSGEVLALELTTDVPTALVDLGRAKLPPVDDFGSALLEAARTDTLLTALPADLTAAGMSAAYHPGIGYLRVSGYAGAPAEDVGARELKTRFLPYQHVYLVREGADEEFHERVSVWLPGSRHLGFLQKQEGERLLRTYDKQSSGRLYRAYLDLEESSGLSAEGTAPATFRVVVCRVTVAGHGRADADDTSLLRASTPVAQDLLRLADDGYPRIGDASRGPVDDSGLYLRRDSRWAEVGSGAVADYLRKLEARGRRGAA